MSRPAPPSLSSSRRSPCRRRGRRRPSAGEQGEHLYGQYCVACHGPTGRGSAAPGRHRRGAAARSSRPAGLAPSLRGVGALAADFYLRTGYMPLPHARRPAAPPPGALRARRRSARWSPTSPRSARARAIPTPAPGAREPRRGAAPLHRPLRRLPPGRGRGRLRHRRRAAAARGPTADADRRGGADRPVRDAALLEEGALRPRARLDHRLRRVREAPRRPRRLGARPPRPGPGGPRDLVHRGDGAGRRRASCIGRRLQA